MDECSGEKNEGQEKQDIIHVSEWERDSVDERSRSSEGKGFHMPGVIIIK